MRKPLLSDKQFGLYDDKPLTFHCSNNTISPQELHEKKLHQSKSPNEVREEPNEGANITKVRSPLTPPKIELFGEMSDSDFRLFQKLIYKEAGINMTDKKKTLVSNRIRKRLRALKIDTYNKYYTYLKKSENRKQEIINMVDVVTTNVTNFFRNPKQFERLSKTIIPEIIAAKKNKRNFRTLSAGCSSGEEPYSIAMTLAEYLGKNLDKWDITIDGVDISTDVIRKAESGIYNEEKIRDVEPAILKKYFTKNDNNNTYTIEKKIKSMVRYKKFNLKSNTFSLKYDIILCRNVVIYFDKETKHLIYQKLYDALNDDGYFLVGHSEGLFNDKRFKYAYPGIYKKNIDIENFKYRRGS